MALANPKNESPHDANSPIYHLNPMAWISAGLSQASLAAFHPRRNLAVRLWKIFVDSVDPHAKVTHLPTAERTFYTVLNDPASASSENLALCFAIYYASVTALPPNEVLHITGEDTGKVLNRYRMYLEQSLAQAEFLDNPTITLLQAMAIYAVSKLR